MRIQKGNYIIGVDVAQGSDRSFYTIAKLPGKFRRLLRKIGLDKSKWEYKIIRTEELL